MKLTEKQARVDIVNLLIKKISETSRGFLKSGDNIGKIIIQWKHLYYVDHYTRKKVYFHQPSYNGFQGFSSGGTLKDLVFREFKEFIDTGKITMTTGLNAWHWGIKENEIIELKNYAKEIGYLN